MASAAARRPGVMVGLGAAVPVRIGPELDEPSGRRFL